MRIFTRVLLIAIVTAAVLAFANFVPTFTLSTAAMTTLRAERFTIHYDPSDQSAAEDIAKRLTAGYEKISSVLPTESQSRTEVYLYPSIAMLHTKKYGLIGALIAPQWYIGDNVRDTILLTSPNSPGKAHDYESVANAAVHEYVHTLMWRVNPNLSKFLNEGMAGYVSGNTKPNGGFQTLPTMDDTKVSDPVAFGNRGLYPVSYTYIEFLDVTYGMANVMKLIQTQDYAVSFGKSEQEIYDEWIEYVRVNYLNL